MVKKKIEKNNQAKEKKLPLGAKIIGGLWLVFSIYSIVMSLFNFIKGNNPLILSLFIIPSILAFSVIIVFSVFYFKRKNFARLALVIIGILASIYLGPTFFIGLLMYFENWVVPVILTILIFGVILCSSIYLLFNKNVKEAFK